MATVTGQSGQAHTSGAAGGASGRMDVFGQWTVGRGLDGPGAGSAAPRTSPGTAR
jgi:hypothetical protein